MLLKVATRYECRITITIFNHYKKHKNIPSKVENIDKWSIALELSVKCKNTYAYDKISAFQNKYDKDGCIVKHRYIACMYMY